MQMANENYLTNMYILLQLSHLYNLFFLRVCECVCVCVDADQHRVTSKVKKGNEANFK